MTIWKTHPGPSRPEWWPEATEPEPKEGPMYEFGVDPHGRCAGHVPIWVMIGKQNPWIAKAWDPAFDHDSFIQAQTIGQLREALTRGNWCLGMGFCFEYEGHAFAFVNQINGGDEWLTIRDGVPFESITAQLCFATDEKTRDYLTKWAGATKEQLQKHEY